MSHELNKWLKNIGTNDLTHSWLVVPTMSHPSPRATDLETSTEYLWFGIYKQQPE